MSEIKAKTDQQITNYFVMETDDNVNRNEVDFFAFGYRSAETPLLEEIAKRDEEIERLRLGLHEAHQEIKRTKNTNMVDGLLENIDSKRKEIEQITGEANKTIAWKNNEIAKLTEQLRFQSHEYLSLEMKLREKDKEIAEIKANESVIKVLGGTSDEEYNTLDIGR